MEQMNLNVADILQRLWKAYIIDKSWKPAVKGGTTCQYAVAYKNGRYAPYKACFVGFFIPREKKFHNLLVSEESVATVYDEYPDLFVDALGVKDLTEGDVHFLDHLQKIHDDAAVHQWGYDFSEAKEETYIFWKYEWYVNYHSAMKASLESFASFHDVELEPAA